MNCGGFPRQHQRSKAVSGRGPAGVLQDGLLPPRVQPSRLQGGRAGVPRGWRTPREHTHAAGTEAHPDAPGEVAFGIGNIRWRFLDRFEARRAPSFRRRRPLPATLQVDRRQHGGLQVMSRRGRAGLRRVCFLSLARREWHSDEPSCGAESCVAMYHRPGVGGAYLYQWNDDRCSMKHNFICKYQPERRPEEERGTTAAGRGAETTPDGNRVTSTGTSGPLALYILLPTVPPLLILAAAAARYRRALGKRSAIRSGAERQTRGSSRSPAARGGHLWISETHKGGGGAQP